MTEKPDLLVRRLRLAMELAFIAEPLVILFEIDPRSTADHVRAARLWRDKYDTLREEAKP